MGKPEIMGDGELQICENCRTYLIEIKQNKDGSHHIWEARARRTGGMTPYEFHCSEKCWQEWFKKMMKGG
jgi:hypothetical protein